MTGIENTLLHSLLTPSSTEPEVQLLLLALIEEVGEKPYDTKLTELPAYRHLREQTPRLQGRVVVALARAVQVCAQEQNWQLRYALNDTLTSLLRVRLHLTQEEIVLLFGCFDLDFSKTDYEARRTGLWLYPFGLALGQLQKLLKTEALQEATRAYLEQLLHYLQTNQPTEVKTAQKLREMLHSGGEANLPTVTFSAADAFGQALNEFVAGLGTDPGAGPWLQLLQLWRRASGGQPTAKFQKEAQAAVAAIGPEAVATHYEVWLSALTKLPVQELSRNNAYGSYAYMEWHFLSSANQEAVKGLLWTSVPVLNAALLHGVAELAAKCYRKIPAKGQLAPSLGNAGVWVLAQGGLPGVTHLSRLYGAVKQTNTQGLIGRYLETASRQLGMTPAELEEMAVPEFGLVNGRAGYELGDYHAELVLAGGKAELHWTKAGKPLKSAPAALKSTHAEALRQLKLTHTQVQHTYTAQRDRLDRSYLAGRRIAWPRFRRYYLEHGLMGELTRALIWRIHHPNGSCHDARYYHGAWRTAQGEMLPEPTDADTLQLWHPVLAPTEEVLAWRSSLDAQQLRQPLKQAYREVYLLTPPEERTRTYSNRMAAHVLRQHQFSALARGRGWSYRLMGAYDKGYEADSATLELPMHELQAQFWVSEVNADNAWNDTGIWNYVSTDQVRFVRQNESVPVTDVPPLAFSEVMRDVDLFVGVASVGNDPLWRDNGGLVQYRNYWESYSFGELSEVAKTRKLALERLVPRLKIGRVSEIRGNFLEVKGKLRTYKIHLGSGNILMKPNDQYLCIVPDRSAKPAATAGVFLPFEGDAVLSIILSKAQLLMDDDTITDETITRQLRRE
ncbi:DUF4132 domain-containing protein [Hymenobacter metallilatus]|nr:DUF4132 domain-containing protein [Hymenobacter metallilatus]